MSKVTELTTLVHMARVRNANNAIESLRKIDNAYIQMVLAGKSDERIEIELHWYRKAKALYSITYMFMALYGAATLMSVIWMRPITTVLFGGAVVLLGAMQWFKGRHWHRRALTWIPRLEQEQSHREQVRLARQKEFEDIIAPNTVVSPDQVGVDRNLDLK